MILVNDFPLSIHNLKLSSLSYCSRQSPDFTSSLALFLRESLAYAGLHDVTTSFAPIPLAFISRSIELHTFKV
jgi:hypothetical protein